MHPEATPGNVSAAPDWALVHFEVGCARCGFNLRGLTEPRCPACRLEFEWADAVPLEQLTCRACGYHLCGLNETRCPECGEAFTWEQALDDHHRKRKPLFEYRWRDEPIRSLVRTWWLAIRPWKLWRVVDLHDPPRVRPLLVFAFSSVLALLAVVITIEAVPEVISEWQFNRLRASRGLPALNLFATLPWRIDYMFRSVFLPGYGRVIGSWGLFSFLALLLFQQSMKKCRVRTAHIFRVWVYTVAAIVPWVAGVIFISTALLGTSPFFQNETTAGTFVWTVGYATLALQLAYSRYIRMRHSLGVTIASQVIAVLATAIVCLLLTDRPSDILIELLSWVGLD